MTEPEIIISEYKDEDLVYVDPEARAVVARVEFDNNGIPKPLAMQNQVAEKPEKGERKRKISERFYPWGTYKSMKRIYRLEGKVKKTVPTATLDEVIGKAMTEPFWD